MKPMTTSDNELLLQYVRYGSQEAFADLVKRHVGWLYTMARRRVHDPATAEDVTQAVFILLAQRAKYIRPNRPLSAWLSRTACHVSSHALRAQKRRRHHENQAATRNAADHSAQRDNSFEPLLDGEVQSLSARDRHAILLRFYEEKPLAEVGLALNISEDAARKRVSRALDRLCASFGNKCPSVLILTEALQVRASVPPQLLAHSSATALAGSSAFSSTALSLAKGTLKMLQIFKMKLALAACLLVLLPTWGVLSLSTHAAVRLEGEDKLREVIAGVEASSARIQTIRAHVLITSELDEPEKPKLAAKYDVQWISKDQRSHFVTRMQQTVDGKEPPALSINNPQGINPSEDTESARSGAVELTFSVIKTVLHAASRCRLAAY